MFPNQRNHNGYKDQGKYQVKDAKNGMMLNIGGSATTNYVFIVGKV